MMQQPQPQGVPPTLPLTVTLEAQQWNSVMAALAETPYRIAAPIIQRIAEQLQAQTAPPQTELPATPPLRPNGADQHPENFRPEAA